MPAPSPYGDESRADYMHRCVPFFVNEGRAQDQAVAMCSRMWETKATDLGEAKDMTMGGMTMDGACAPPMADETHADFLDRCVTAHVDMGHSADMAGSMCQLMWDNKKAEALTVEAVKREVAEYKAAGNPAALIEWFNNGADGAIDWGSPGDYEQCVTVAEKHMDSDQAHGFCQLRHMDATGMTTSQHAHEGKAQGSDSCLSTETVDNACDKLGGCYVPEAKYSPDQPRDPDGRFGSGGGGTAVEQNLGARILEGLGANARLTTPEASTVPREPSHPADPSMHTAHTLGGVDRSPKIPGIGSVDQYLAAHPMLPGERTYEYQSRIVDGLNREQKDAMLFLTRETYEPVKFMADGAARYRDEHGLPQPQLDLRDVRVDETKADAVARAFETTPDQSGDPKVQAAYEDFKRQNDEQWHLLTDPPEKGGLGVKVDFVQEDEPYPSAAAQAADIRDNHHLLIASGLGGAHEASMSTEEYDRFRAVHDAFGHAGIGGGFDRHGEYQAYLMHQSMYTPPGAQAMATEYHGVNSALWTGDPNDPGGTGKTILLPEELTRNPFDEHGNLVGKSDEALTKAAPADEEEQALQYLADKLELDSEWAHRYSTPPWHPLSPVQSAKSTFAEMCEQLGIKYSPDQPRDPDGRFGSGGGGTAVEQNLGARILQGLSANAALTTPEASAQLSTGTGTKDDPIKTGDPVVAARALGENKYVELDQPRTVSAVLDKIKEFVDDAKAKGQDAPTYNLCNATVAGTNLFCVESKGIPRIRMPQLAGVPEKGSWADRNLPKNERGEADLGPAFIDHLKERGVNVSTETVPAENLRATQTELNGANVAGLVDAMQNGTYTPAQIFVSKDDYVVDGHHRWAAEIGDHLAGAADSNMQVQRVDMPILNVLAAAYNFAQSNGIAPRGVSTSLVEHAGGGKAFTLDPAGDATLPPKDGRSRRTSQGDLPMSTKRAVYDVAEFKALGPEDGAKSEGEFTALVSVFGNVDLQGDRVVPGAYKADLERWVKSGDPIPVIWSHDWSNPAAHIGYIDPGKAFESDHGLVVSGKIDLDNPFAKQVHRLLVERRVKQWSFAYDVHRETRNVKDGANDLIELGIIEVGPTLKGANTSTDTITAKALEDAMVEYKAGRRLSSTTVSEISAIREDISKLDARLSKLLGEASAEEDGEPEVKTEPPTEAKIDVESIIIADNEDPLAKLNIEVSLDEPGEKSYTFGPPEAPDKFRLTVDEHGVHVEDDTGKQINATFAKAAIGPHSSGTSTGSWDGPANEARVTSPNEAGLAYFKRIYAWRDTNGDPNVKASYRFIHHEVGADGTPGAANLTACSAGIAVLNGGRGGTTIPAADRQGVWDHLAAHLRAGDATPPALKSEEGSAKAEHEADREPAAKSVTTEHGEEPGATPDGYVPDTETILLRTRIEEMRAR